VDSNSLIVLSYIAFIPSVIVMLAYVSVLLVSWYVLCASLAFSYAILLP